MSGMHRETLQRVELRRVPPVALASLIAFLSATVPAQAQRAETDVPQTLWLEAGGFRVASATRLSLFGEVSRPEDPIDFENAFEVPGTTTQGYLEGFWRAARRHQLSLGWQRIRRDGNGVTLETEIQWGDDVIEVGAAVQSTTDSDFLSGAYRFALFKNEKLEVGPAAGIGYTWITVALRAEWELTTGGETRATAIDSVSRQTSITGDLGGYLYWWPGQRWLVRGDFRFMALGLEEADAGITEGRASLTWYAWRNVGFSGQYLYTRFRYDRKRSTAGLNGNYQYDGLQFLVNVAF